MGPFVNVRANDKDLILEFDAEEIYDDSYDGEEDDWMGSLLPLREDVLREDYRCLYRANALGGRARRFAGYAKPRSAWRPRRN